ncbi:hypothetical protein [Photobacterium damselae]|uniref:hypothetical protein n=1 Tax=Photobacterium damselae TaxID=38293 RepID=UPI001593EC84|nr:hypothetical protein [Photobacterium damselae]NVH48434.1 hypothetical protein [Photobacterium damselae subsp. damselae]
MKKLTLASLILATMSTGAFAAISGATGTDTTSATLTWKADVPTVVPGQWITFTGEGAGTVADGTLKIEPTGAFSSSAVKLELREYNSDTGVVGEGLDTTASVIKSINYVVEEPTLTSSDATHDLSSVKAQIMETSGNIGTSLPANTVVSYGDKYLVDNANGWATSWTIQNAPGTGITGLTAGEEIKATSIIRADVDFA